MHGWIWLDAMLTFDYRDDVFACNMSAENAV